MHRLTYFNIIRFFVLILSVSSCTAYDFESQLSNHPGNGEIRIFANYDIPQEVSVSTKNIERDREYNIENAFLFIFEASDIQAQQNEDRLLQIVEAEIDNNVQNQLSFVVNPCKENCRIKVIANLSAENVAVIRKYELLKTTIADFKKLVMPSSNLQGESATQSLPLCSADPIVHDGINKYTDLTLTLKRIYARIEIALASTVTNFELQELYLKNGYKYGRFEPYSTGEFPGYIDADYESVVKPITDDFRGNVIYLYENIYDFTGATQPATLVVKGVYKKDGNSIPGYYKIYVEYLDSNQEYDYSICRNTIYKVLIKKVKHFGYPTLKEALHAESENSSLELDVNIDDFGASNDIIYHSSGYAISVTNSEALIYASSPESSNVLTTICFDTTHYTTFIPSRSIKVLNNDKNILVANSNEILNAPFGTPVDIKIKLAKPDISGTIEVRFGGLRKLIKVQSFKMLRSDKQYHIEVPNVLNVEEKSEYQNTWFKYANSLEYPAGINQNLTFNTPTTVYCMAPENKGETREASPVYFYRQTGGTLKLIATQTYGSPYINDLYFRETGDRVNTSHKEKRANSLLIPTKQAQTYRLTGSRIYDYYGSNFTVPNPKAEIVWSDFKFKDPNPFEPHDLIEVENPSGNFEDVIFRVRKYHANCGNAGNGNVIWGIKDDKGSWVWSWHAWLTDMVEETNYSYLPNIAYSGYWGVSILANKSEIRSLFESNNAISQKCLKTNVGGVLRVYLDRNMGAKTLALISSSITQSEGLKHYGLYYQWGRKDPFPVDSTIFTLMNPEVGERIKKTEIKHSVAQSLQNPLTFIVGQKDSYDWCSDPSAIRWNKINGSLQKHEKTVFDPSPYGWRLNWGNGNDIFSEIDTKWLSFSDSKAEGGMLISDKYWFPATGYYYFSHGRIIYKGTHTLYWTSSNPSDLANGYCAYFYGDNGKLINYKDSDYYVYRTFGTQVRPVLDTN